MKTATLSHFEGEYFLNGKKLDPTKSQEFYNHSPDGFNHGYAGSGPAQLALAIFLELYGTDRIKVNQEDKTYQGLKFNVIGGLPQGKNFEVEFSVFIPDGQDVENKK